MSRVILLLLLAITCTLALDLNDLSGNSVIWDYSITTADGWGTLNGLPYNKCTGSGTADPDLSTDCLLFSYPFSPTEDKNVHTIILFNEAESIGDTPIYVSIYNVGTDSLPDETIWEGFVDDWGCTNETLEGFDALSELSWPNYVLPCAFVIGDGPNVNTADDYFVSVMSFLNDYDEWFGPVIISSNPGTALYCGTGFVTQESLLCPGSSENQWVFSTIDREVEARLPRGGGSFGVPFALIGSGSSRLSSFWF